jgi:4-hydroxy-L-threonine phosphate dehydrogenase PdxA
VNVTLGLPILRTSVDHGTASISPARASPTRQFVDAAEYALVARRAA